VDVDAAISKLLLDLRQWFIKDLNYSVALYDQAIESCDNLSITSRWFDNLRLIIVLRDPRDQYLSWKLSALANHYPTDPVDFCDYFEMLMHDLTPESSNVLHIQYEDFVKSEAVRNTVRDFAGLSNDDHLRSGKMFRWNESITRVSKWKASTDPALAYIGRRLVDYCYIG